MKAFCLDCMSMVEADDELVRQNINGPEVTCDDVEPKHCKGDDYTEDHRLDDPRHGQAADINRSNKR